MAFFWDKHITENIPRGPFPSSEQWLKARLLLTRSDCEAVIANESDEEELEDAESTMGLASQLLELMSKYLPSEGESDDTEWCCLQHDDMSGQNILVDSS